MRITLELNENQATVFQETLETTLQSLVFQELQIKEALDDTTNPSELGYLNDFLGKIAPQRVLIAEILHTVNQADKKTKITTDLSNTPKGLRGESIFE